MIWKYLERRGSILKQKVIDGLFRQIMLLKEALLDTRKRAKCKYAEECLRVTLKSKKGCARLCDNLEKRKE